MQDKGNPAGRLAEQLKVIKAQAGLDLFLVFKDAGYRPVNIANGDRKPVAAGFGHKLSSLLDIGKAFARLEERFVRRGRAGFVAHHRAEFGFAGQTGLVGQVGHLAGGGNVCR